MIENSLKVSNVGFGGDGDDNGDNKKNKECVRDILVYTLSKSQRNNKPLFNDVLEVVKNIRLGKVNLENLDSKIFDKLNYVSSIHDLIKLLDDMARNEVDLTNCINEILENIFSKYRSEYPNVALAELVEALNN